MLNKSDYNDITMLINISSSICRNFQELCQLEIAGIKESQEYQEYFEKIKEVSLKDIKRIYDYLDVHFDYWFGEADSYKYIP